MGMADEKMPSVMKGKATTITCVAVLDAVAFRHHGGLIKRPLKPYLHHNTMILRDLRGLSIRPPGLLASQTANERNRVRPSDSFLRE